MLYEFSRILDTNKLGNASETWNFKATPLECAAIKKRLKILDLKFLTTHGSIKKNPTHKFIEIEASLEALLVLECTASLEPFPYTAHPQLRFWVSKDFTAETHASLYEDSDVDELIKMLKNEAGVI